MIDQPRLLITGAAGFLASNLVYQLNQLGYTNLTLVDRLGKTDKWRNLVGLKYAEYLEVDAFRARRQQTRCDFDVVFALGANSSTREIDASHLMSNNLADMIDLYQWCEAGERIHWWDSYALGRTAIKIPKPPRFIYASSAATFGSGPMDDSLSPTSLKPLNPYAQSKNMVDQWFESRGLLDKVVGLKYYNVFGMNSRHKGIMVDFVAKCFDQMRTQGHVEIYDTHLHGPEVPGISVRKDSRDFLYVKDAVDMTIHFAFGAGKTSNGLFNIGSGRPISWREVAAHTLLASIGYKTDMRTDDYIRFAPMPPALKSTFQFYTCADISKLRATGYAAPITPIAAAIQDYVTNYLMPDKRRGEIANSS